MSRGNSPPPIPTGSASTDNCGGNGKGSKTGVVLVCSVFCFGHISAGFCRMKSSYVTGFVAVA